MSKWTVDELTKIGMATELQLSSIRKDGTVRKPVTIWVVQVDDDLFVRAIGGPTGKWFQHALEIHQGHINAGGISKDVNFIEVEAVLLETIDEAYKNKYQRYGNSIVGSTLTTQARAATLKLQPR